MRKLFLTMGLGLALGAAGLPAARGEAAEPRPAPLVQVHYDGHGRSYHHWGPPRHWRHSHGFHGGDRHWYAPRHDHGRWRDRQDDHRRHEYQYGSQDRFHHHGR